MSAFSSSLGDAVLRLIADPNQLIAGLNKANKSVDKFAENIEKTGSKLQSIGFQAAAMGAAISAAFTLALGPGVKFERQMSTLAAVLDGITQDQLTALSDKAKEVGLTTQFSAVQAAEGMVALAKAGLTAQQTLEGFNGVVSLAIAGNMELGQAAEVAANIMNTFSLSADQLSRVADVLALTANKSTVEVVDLAESLKYAGNLASQFGLTLEQTNAALGVLGNVGLRGSLAGTSLNAVLRDLTKQTPRFKKGLVDLGMTSSEVSPLLNSMGTILERFKEKGLDASKAMKMFDTEGARAILSLMSQADNLKEFEADLNNSAGSAQKFGTVMKNNVSGSIKGLQAALEGLKISVFDQLKSKLQEIIDRVTEFVHKINLWVKSHGELVAQLTIVIGSLGAFLVVFGSIATVLGTIVSSIGTLVGAISTLIGSFGAAGAAGSGLLGIIGSISAALSVGTAGAAAIVIAAIAGIVTAISGVVALVVSQWDKVQNAMSAFMELVSAVVSNIVKGFMYVWNFVKPIFQWISIAFGRLMNSLAELWEALQPFAPAFQVLGAILGAIVLGPLTVLVAAIAGLLELLNAGVKIITWIVDTGRSILEWLGLIDKAADSIDRLKASEEELKKTQSELIKSSEAVGTDLQKRTSLNKQLLDLETKKGDLTLQQIMQYRKLLEEKSKLQSSDEQTLTATKNQIAAIEKEIERRNANGQSTLALRTRLQELEKAQDDLIKSIDANKKADEGLTRVRQMNVDQAKELEESTRKLMYADEQRKAVIDDAKESEKDLGEIRTELSRRHLAEVDQELAKIDDQIQKEKDLLQVRMTLLKGAIDADVAAGRAPDQSMINEYESLQGTLTELDKKAEEEKQKIREKFEEKRKELENKQLEEEYKRSDERIKLAELEARLKREKEEKEINEAFTASKDATPNEAAELEKRRQKALAEAKKEYDSSVQEAIKKEQEARDKMTDEQKKIMDDLQRKQIQQSGDRIKEAEFEADKWLEIEKKRIREIAEERKKLDPVNANQIDADAARAEAEATKIAELEKAKAIEEAAKETVEAAKQNNLNTADQQKAQDQLNEAIKARIALIKKLRQESENDRVSEGRAIELARAAEAARLSYEKAKARGVTGDQLSKMDYDARTREALARKAAGKAGLALPIKSLDGTATVQAAQNLANQIQQLQQQIVQTIADIEKDLHQAGVDSVDTYWQGWMDEWPQFMQWIRDAMADLKHELDVDTKHSPSLRQVMGENVDVVASGVDKMAASLVGPGLSNLNRSIGALTSTIQSRPGFDVSGFQGAHADSYNDNSTQNFNVTSALDVQDVTRHIQNTFRRKGRRL